MKMLVQEKIQRGFAVALAFLLLTGVTAWWSASQNVETFRAVDHSRQILDHIQDTFMATLAIQTGSRGFAITGEELFLDSYSSAKQAVEASFAAAKPLLRDNPIQQERLAALESLIQKRISLASEVVELRRRGDTAGALQFIASGQGNEAMDEVRRWISEMEREENEVLARRMARAQVMSRTTIAVVVFSGFLSIVLVGLAGVLVRRDLEARQRAEAERDRFFTLSPDMLCIARTDGYFERINSAFTATLGWSMEELLAKPYLDFVHPDDRPATLREIEKLAADEKVFCFLNRCQCKDGSWRVLSWKSLSQPDGHIYATARDVTELKEAEEALRRSEQSLSITLQSIGDGVLATDAERRVTRLNPIAEALTGWTEMEALGRPIDEVFRIINEETRQPAVIPVDEVLATGVIHGLANHTVLVGRDGAEHAIADSAAPIRDKQGAIAGVVLVFRDESKKRVAEKQVSLLLKELQDLKFALDEHCIVAITDPQGRITYANDRFCAISQYSREELLGQDHRIINSGYHGKEFMRDLWTTISAGRVWKGEINNRAKDGSCFWLATAIVPFLNPDGKPFQYVTIRTDITERKRAEDELARLNNGLERHVAERSAAIREAHVSLDLIDDAVFIFDPDTLCFSYVNEGATRQLGYTREELAGKTVLEIKPECQRAEFNETLARMRRGELASRRFETIHCRKDGREIPVETNLQLVCPEGGMPLFIAVVRDIRERKQAEQALRESQERVRRMIEDIFRFVPEALLVFTANLNLYKHNQAFEALVQNYAAKLSYTESELREKLLQELKAKMLGAGQGEIRIPPKAHDVLGAKK